MLQCSMIMDDDAHDQGFNCFLTSRMLQQELPSTKLEENVDEKVMYIVYMSIDHKKNNRPHNIYISAEIQNGSCIHVRVLLRYGNRIEYPY